jgi:hypothetical protein
MGTDSIKLFNKTLADEILAMEREPLTRFLVKNLDAFRRKKFCFNAVLLEVDQNGGSVPNVVERLLTEEYTLAELKAEVARLATSLISRKVITGSLFPQIQTLS